MARSPEDTEFMIQMAKQLDESILELSKRELVLIEHIGAERVEEIRELWDRALEPAEDERLRRSLDWHDRELLWIWSRQRRAHSARANLGKAFMKQGLEQDRRES